MAGIEQDVRSTAEPTRPVWEACDSLNNSVSNLEATLLQLVQRLSSVYSSSPTAAEQPPVNGTLSSIIKSYSNRVRDCNQLIDSILKEMEL